MGRDKAALPWGDSTLLASVCAVIGRSLGGPVVVVRAAGQDVPPLPAGVELVDDPAPDLGPVQGLAAGLRAVEGRADVAFAAATDLPLLHEAVVRRVVRELVGRPDRQVVAPEAEGRLQLLAAAFRPDVAASLESALLSGERRLRTVVAQLSVHLLGATELLADPDVAAHDPQLRSFTNVNDPQEYARARAARRG
jgi:molybdopterin-guanine dinucleotide biosynthesis protein A